MFFEQICIHVFFQYPIFQNITFCKYIFVNNFFVNSVFDDFENIHVLKKIKILKYYQSFIITHTQNKLDSPSQTNRLHDNIHMQKFNSKKTLMSP